MARRWGRCNARAALCLPKHGRLGFVLELSKTGRMNGSRLRPSVVRTRPDGHAAVKSVGRKEVRVLDWRAPSIVTSLAWMCAASIGSPQEASVKPGINERYADPDMDSIEAVLEREDRAIYKYRHAIVAALALEPGMSVADVGAGTGFIARLMGAGSGTERKSLRRRDLTSGGRLPA